MVKKQAPKKSAKKSTPAAKTATARKVGAKKSTASSKAKAKPSKPAGPREQKLASGALKLVDEAAALLRKGIKSTANVSEKNREEARKRAHSLLTQAAGSLGGLLDSGASALHKAISKI